MPYMQKTNKDTLTNITKKAVANSTAFCFLHFSH